MEAGLCDVYVRVRASMNKHACMSVCMYGETRMDKTYVRRRHVYIQTYGGHVCRSLACFCRSLALMITNEAGAGADAVVVAAGGA